MADIRNLISQASKSKIAQTAKSFVNKLDRDQSMSGFQVIPGGFNGGVQRAQTTNFTNNSLTQGMRNVLQTPVPRAAGLINFTNRLEQSPLGAPSRFVKGFGESIAKSASLSGSSLGDRQKLINERQQGKSFKERLQGFIGTGEENKLLAQGGYQAAKTLAQLSPGKVGGLKSAPAVLTAGGIPAALNAAITPGDRVGAAGKGFGEGLGLRTITRFTDPMIDKAVGGIGGNLAAKQLGQRVTAGIGNIGEDEIISNLEGQKPQRGLSFLLGLAAAGNVELSGALTKKIKSALSGGDQTQMKQVAEEAVALFRDQQGRFTNKLPQLDDTRELMDVAISPENPLGGMKIKARSRLQPDNVTVKNIFGQEVMVPRAQMGGIQLGPSQSKSIVKDQSGSSEAIISQARKEIGTIKDEKAPSLREAADEFYTQWVDRFHPVVQAAQKAKGKLKTQNASLRPEYDPEYLVRRFSGAGGIADARFRQELKPIIDELETAKVDKLDMDVYLKARRDIGLAERGVLGSDSNQATQRIIALEQKYPGIQNYAKKFYDYQNKGFQEMIDAGFLSKESADVIRQQNPDYVPFERVMEEVNNYLGVPSAKLTQGTNPLKKMKGSNLQIYSPVESIIANTFSQRAAIEKNRVAKSIVGLQDIAPDLGFEKVTKSGNDTIAVWNNGQKEFWKVGPEIAETAKGLDEENMNAVLKILSKPASWLRQGATGKNPDFLIPNIVKDQLDAGLSSKYGYIPFVDYLSGLKSMLRNDDVYQRWERSGANIDLGEMSGRKTIQKSFDEATARKGLFNWLGDRLDTLGKYSEQPTRVGLFKKAYKKTGNELLSVMESRDSTVDFSRMGSKMRTANSIIPFLNVGVQGFDKLMRQVKNNPGKLALNAGIYAALPAATLATYNLINNPEEYAEVPQYVKDANFVLVKGRNDNGTVDYFTIPKGNIVPLIANPIESLLAYAAGNSQQTLSEFANQFISSALPVLAEGSSPQEIATKTVGANLPQAIKPLSENLLNKSFYKYDTKDQEAKAIVPEYLKNKPAYQQAYEWTPRMYKAIGAALNVSPLQIQNLMEGYLAGFTKVPNNIIDSVFNAAEGKEVRKGDIPILRRFMSTTFPSSGTKEVVKPQAQTPGLMERLVGKADASTGSVDSVDKMVTTEVRDNIRDRVKYGNEVSEQELYDGYLDKAITMPKGNRYEEAQRTSELFSSLSDIQRNEYLSDQQKDTLKKKIVNEINGVSNSQPTKLTEKLQVSTREADNFPFPDFSKSAPGQVLRADLNFDGYGDADITLHFRAPDGRVFSVPQSKEKFSGGKQEYGLEMEMPRDAGIGTGEIWATVNGKEVTGSRKKHEIVNVEAVNRYASGSNAEEYQRSQNEINSIRANNSTFSSDRTKQRVTLDDLDTYQIAKEDNNSKTLHALDKRDELQTNEEYLQFLVNGRRPINGKTLISDGVIDNLVTDGIIPPEIGKELKGIDLNADGTIKQKKTKSKSKKAKKAKVIKIKSRLKGVKLPKLKIKKVKSKSSKSLTLTG